jgi:polyisoprenoid-binding protein YceI
MQFHGRLTLRGRQGMVPMTIDALDCNADRSRCVFEASASVLRRSFGMHSKRGLVANRVGLRIRGTVLHVR